MENLVYAYYNCFKGDINITVYYICLSNISLSYRRTLLHMLHLSMNVVVVKQARCLAARSTGFSRSCCIGTSYFKPNKPISCNFLINHGPKKLFVVNSHQAVTYGESSSCFCMTRCLVEPHMRQFYVFTAQ